MMIPGLITTGSPSTAPPAVTRLTASRTPMIPPRADRIADSVRNWIRTSRVLAPSAFQIPISRVLSVTDTSMMFMIPMPPTRREIAAIPPTAMESPPMRLSMDPISFATVFV